MVFLKRNIKFGNYLIINSFNLVTEFLEHSRNYMT